MINVSRKVTHAYRGVIFIEFHKYDLRKGKGKCKLLIRLIIASLMDDVHVTCMSPVCECRKLKSTFL
jgi:hypothetical protein